ncbi:MAG: hypothetical protein ABIJ96_00890 [Elusimicrobiota bacterium]
MLRLLLITACLLPAPARAVERSDFWFLRRHIPTLEEFVEILHRRRQILQEDKEYVFVPLVKLHADPAEYLGMRVATMGIARDLNEALSADGLTFALANGWGLGAYVQVRLPQPAQEERALVRDINAAGEERTKKDPLQVHVFIARGTFQENKSLRRSVHRHRIEADRIEWVTRKPDQALAVFAARAVTASGERCGERFAELEGKRTVFENVTIAELKADPEKYMEQWIGVLGVMSWVKIDRKPAAIALAPKFGGPDDMLNVEFSKLPPHQLTELMEISFPPSILKVNGRLEPRDPTGFSKIPAVLVGSSYDIVCNGTYTY